MFNDILRAVGPIVAAAMAARSGKFDSGQFRFDNGHFHFDSELEGAPLEELDLTGGAPEKIVLFGSTHVRIIKGKTFRIKTVGDGADALRFSLSEGRLAITRSNRPGDPDGSASVKITMPAPRSLVIAGSGVIETGTLAKSAKIVIAGSGAIELTGIASERLKANIMGSGHLRASGAVDRLKLNIAGSGSAEMAGLEAAKAKIAVAGSGNAAFASDGTVEASMMGSGCVTIHGRARCSVHSMGSGQIRCIPREEAAPKQKPKPGKRAKPKPAKTAKTAKGRAKPKAATKAKRKPASKRKKSS